LILLFSISQRAIRISTGENVKNVLPEEMCRNIINRIILPKFQEQDYFGGIKQGLEVLIAKWE
ncbi:MAG: TPM domain-containing protein, partial [Leeuwenhoekiella sp.]